MSALPSSRKTHSEKHKQIFRQLLKELPNKSCVDCKLAQHPRWASWNLGCFICIRCSGIHRSMGTHISRVKSVDLDVWTDEQVESMIKWGNEKCNLFWEAKLPANYIPDASKIENFIRTKYDLKKWAALLKVPDPMTITGSKNGVSEAQTPAHSAPPVSAQTTPKIATRPKHVSASAPLLLDDDFGDFASSTLDLTSKLPAHSPSSFTSTKPGPVPAKTASVQPASPATPTPAPPRANDTRSDLKKSILSLYSSPSSSSSSVHQQPANFRQSVLVSSPHTPLTRALTLPVQAASHVGVSDLSDSLLGLNFGAEPVTRGSSVKPSATLFASSPQPLIRTQTHSSSSTPTAQPQWANEWNDSSSSVNQWGSAYNGTNSLALGSGFPGTFGNVGTGNSTGLKSATEPDDDLFKNVWS